MNKIQLPMPIIDEKEEELLNILTEKYQILIEPSKISKIGTKIGQLVPSKVKEFGQVVGTTLTEKEFYIQMMNYIESGFKTIEEQAAKFSISESKILEEINEVSTISISTLDEICMLRVYEISSLVNRYRNKDMFITTLEGASTGALGFWGLPFNIVFSTFLYFRAVQSIATFYGYDVKRDSTELVIASEVFTKALNPSSKSHSGEMTDIIGKIMIMSQATMVKQTAKKTWTDMINRGGVPLLLTQMRALAHKSAQKALNNTGVKGLENSIFREAFEQIGRQLTLKNIGKVVPVVSSIMGALIDTAQMKKVLEYADLFYQKRFLLEKESRISHLQLEQEKDSVKYFV